MSDPSGPADGRSPQEGGVVPPDLYEVRISGSPEAIARVLREFALDIGCRRPHVERNPDGTLTLLAYASEERIRELQTARYVVERGENVSALGRERQREVGSGDRYEGGRQTPKGLGEKRPRGEKP